jgi:hypothetical protein
VAHDFFGDVADQQPFDAGAAMGGEDDEIAHAILRDFENSFQGIAAANMVAYLVQPLYMVAAELFQQDFRMLLSRPPELGASLWLAFVRPKRAGSIWVSADR